MAYSRTTWKDNEAPYLNANNLNKMEIGIDNNDAKIEENTTKIEQNTTDIADNTTDIDINTDNILGLSVGEVYQGTWTPEAGTEYPSSPEAGHSYYITGLDDNGYTFLTGSLLGRVANNSDKMIYNGSSWSMIDNTNEMLGYYLVDDIESMLALSPLQGAFCHVYGYYSANDGGGGEFNYDSALAGTNNGGTIINGWVRQYSDIVSVKWFGATTDRVDNEIPINAALDIANEIDIHRVDCGGELYTISDSIIFTKKNTYISNVNLVADASWTNDFLDYTDMGTAAGGESEQQKLNRGRPMISVIRDNTSYTGAEFRGLGISGFSLDGNNVAPGICAVESRHLLIDNGRIVYCTGYGLSMLVKNSESRLSNTNISEDVWNGPKYTDPTLYDSAGFVQTCADITVDNVTCYYAQYPIWVDGFSNTQWTNIHPYNGNALATALPNIYVGPATTGIMASNTYSDNGYIELHSFSHMFLGGKLTKSAASDNLVFARIVAQTADTEVDGLIINNIIGSDSALDTAALDITTNVGSNVTKLNNSDIRSIGRGGATPPPRNGYANNKRVNKTVDNLDWIADGEYFRYDYDIEPDLLFIDVYTLVLVVLRDRRTANGVAPVTDSFRFSPNSGTGTKTVSVYSDIAIDCDITYIINEGFGITS